MVVPVWRSKNHVDDARPPRAVVLRDADAARLLEVCDEPIFLGEHEGAPWFAVDLSHVDDPQTLGLTARFADLRMAGSFMDASEAQLLGYARAMCRWHRTAKHCQLCGGPLRQDEAGFARVCAECGDKTFPRTDPAVMILITRGDECLLARQARWPKGMYSALAGFVEPGETLEECVAREALEEVGMHVRDITYLASQPWPFPHQLMIGFQCTVDDDAVVSLDDDELEEARWVHRDALAKPDGFSIPPPLSLAHALIMGFARGTK